MDFKVSVQNRNSMSHDDISEYNITDNTPSDKNSIAVSKTTTSETKDAAPKEDVSAESSRNTAFKKPALFIGPQKGKSILRISFDNKSIKQQDQILKGEKDNETESKSRTENETQSDESSDNQKNNELDMEKERKDKRGTQIPLLYKEPVWSGRPDKKYEAEVLKSGTIIETIDMSEKNFYIVGRLPVCDVSLSHPTISRYHAVFQFRSVPDVNNERGMYLFDLGSTHGTFWNGNRIRPNVYVRIRGGHMIRFGNSRRKYIMQTPPEEEEQESEFTMTELKEKRRLELKERERAELERSKEEKLAEKSRIEREGIDWGIGEDADEETDLTENPYAQTNNEELFLNDPKKTLRGWFECEGMDLQYNTEENGIAKFTCWVNLPIENYVGKTIRAKATVKGKKKEAVVQCALEACRILDRYGLLRQANHEARKKRVRNWEAEDFYDSDEDNFLDRTGTVEKKREQRMRVAGKLDTIVETHTSLTEKHRKLSREIADIETRLEKSRQTLDSETDSSSVDALDAFMSQLEDRAVLNKSETIKLKMDLQRLRKEEEQLLKLIDISRPANLPALKPQDSSYAKISKTESMIKSFMHEKTVKGSNTAETIKQETRSDRGTNSEEITNSYDKLKSGKRTVGEYINTETDESSETKSKIKKTENDGNTVFTDNISQFSSLKNNKEASRKVCNKREEENSETEVEIARRKERNLKRMKQRALKEEREKMKSYEDEIYNEDYCIWVPPEGQSGDGKTSLNEKMGY